MFELRDGGTRPIRVLLATLFVALLAVGCGDRAGTISDRHVEGGAATSNQPYAGWESRPIRALDPVLVEDLLAGRGAGYALAAELNRYPGPTHVLKMADELSLSPAQNASVQAIFDEMQAVAQVLGREMVDLEADLDRRFNDGSVSKPLLRQLTAEIAVVDGKLRSSHLAAHLDVVSILSQEQVDKYDELRGYRSEYTSGAVDQNQHGGH